MRKMAGRGLVYSTVFVLVFASILSASRAQSNSVQGAANGASSASTVTVLGVTTALNLASVAPVTLPPSGGSSTNQSQGVNLGVPALTVLQAGPIVNTTSGSIGAASATAESSSTVDNVNIMAGLVTASRVVSKSRSDGNGTLATSTAAGTQFTNLVVAGNPINDQPAPNTVIPITNANIGLLSVSGTVTLNAQVLSGDGIITSSLTVNAITVNVTGSAAGGLTSVNTNVLVASASSGLNFTAPLNSCPSVSVSGGSSRTVQAGQTLTFTVAATDPDGGTVTLQATNIPANARFTPNPTIGTPTAIGTFTFTPVAAQANQTFNVSFIASDNQGCSAPTPVTVQINVTSTPPPNSCPIVTVNGGTSRTVQADQTLTFVVSATDSDGGTVTLQATNIPANASFTPNPAIGTPTASGIFTFTPVGSQANQTFNVRFSASDNQGCSAPTPVTVQIDVTSTPPPNSCPIVTVNGGTSRTVQVGLTLMFTVSATDSDGGTVTLRATNIPANASFTPNPATGAPTASGIFTFTPVESQANQTFNVSFSASDNQGCSDAFSPIQVVTISVIPGGQVPASPW